MYWDDEDPKMQLNWNLRMLVEHSSSNEPEPVSQRAAMLMPDA